MKHTVKQTNAENVFLLNFELISMNQLLLYVKNYARNFNIENKITPLENQWYILIFCVICE